MVAVESAMLVESASSEQSRSTKDGFRFQLLLFSVLDSDAQFIEFHAEMAEATIRRRDDDS